MREIAWLEWEDASTDVIDDIVHQIADVVCLFPVAGLRLSDNTIVAVNDHYFLSPQGHMPPACQETVSSQHSLIGSVSPASVAKEAAVQGTSNISRSTEGGRNGLGGDQNQSSGAGQTESSIIPSSGSLNPPNGSHVAKKDGSNWPERSMRCEEKFPFIGILTIEDPAGLQQAIKIVFCIQIKTTSKLSSVVTAVTVDNLRFLLPSPDSEKVQSLSIPNKQHFRCIRLALSIGPNLSEAP